MWRLLSTLFLLLLLAAMLPHAAAAAARMTPSQARRELGLSGDSSFIDPAELKAAYRRRSLETHPDKAGGSNEAFVRVSEAYQVLSSESSGSSSGFADNKFSNDNMDDAERLRRAEDLFFEMFGDLFDNDRVGAAIDAFFKDVEATFWIRVLKKGLKWTLPKLVQLLEGDNTIINLNGVTMTGKEFKELRQARANRIKVKEQHGPNEDL